MEIGLETLRRRLDGRVLDITEVSVLPWLYRVCQHAIEVIDCSAPAQSPVVPLPTFNVHHFNRSFVTLNLTAVNCLANRAESLWPCLQPQ